jgi:hypothetical protein
MYAKLSLHSFLLLYKALPSAGLALITLALLLQAGSGLP